MSLVLISTKHWAIIKFKNLWNSLRSNSQRFSNFTIAQSWHLMAGVTTKPVSFINHKKVYTLSVCFLSSCMLRTLCERLNSRSYNQFYFFNREPLHILKILKQILTPKVELIRNVDEITSTSRRRDLGQVRSLASSLTCSIWNYKSWRNSELFQCFCAYFFIRQIGQRWPEAMMYSWGSYFVPVPKYNHPCYIFIFIRDILNLIHR